MKFVPTRLTVLLFLAGGLLLLLPVGNVGRWALAGSWDGLILLLLLIDVFREHRSTTVLLRRELSRKLFLGEQNPIRLHLDNPSGRTFHLILRDTPPSEFVADQHEMHVTLPPHGRLIVEYQLLATDRGNHSFGDLFIRCLTPWGMAWFDRTVPAAEALPVYPNLLDVRRYEALVRARLQIGEGYKVRRIGSGREFSHFRDYTEDDDFRYVNWRASARRTKLITTVFESEHSQEVIFCLDTGRMMAAHVGLMTKLDHAINAILMLTHISLKFQDNLGLLVFSHSVQQYLPPSKGRFQYAKFLEALYNVKAEPCYVNYREAFEYLVRRQTKRSLVMVFTDLLDATVSAEYQSAVKLLGQFHLPLTLAVADVPLQELSRKLPGNREELYSTTVAKDLLQQRQDMLRNLEREGLPVLDTIPDRLTIDAVNRYVQLKMGMGW